jgi:hypothetical protein
MGVAVSGGESGQLRRNLEVFLAGRKSVEEAWLEMLGNTSLGACKRMREGCIELGPWLPFYGGYVCGACLRADQAQLANGEWRKHGLPL